MIDLNPDLPVFLTDADDVLVDFVFPAAELLSEVLGRKWTLDDMTPGEWDMFAGLNEEQLKQVQETLNDYGWVWSLEPNVHTQEAVEKLRGQTNLFVLTAAIGWAPVRTEWLAKHYEFDKDHLVFTKAKYLVRGDFFLDDNPTNVRMWQKHNPQGVGMLWTAPNNIHLIEGNEDIRVYGWPDVYQRVEEWRPA